MSVGVKATRDGVRVVFLHPHLSFWDASVYGRDQYVSLTWRDVCGM